jgi:hypothetical protein
MKFCLKKWQFYLLSFTWGIVMTSIGCTVSIIFMAFGKYPDLNQHGWYFTLGKNWGGVTLGCMCIVSEPTSQHILDHEFGHSVQNCIFGPFMIFISLASAVRYWWREFQERRNKKLAPYDAIWFEGQATSWGEAHRKGVQ